MEGRGSIPAEGRAREGVRGIFYGWWIVGAATIGGVLNSGLYFYGFSTFFVPIINEFGWTRAALSGAFSLSRLEGGILGPIEGYLIDRFGPQKLMLIGIPLMGLGYIILSQVSSLWLFYLVFAVFITMGASLGTMTPLSTAVANWFIRKRSLAFGLMWSGSGISGAAIPFLALLIGALGWRTALFVVGLIIWAVGLPLILVVRHRPEKMGLFPDGEPLPATVSASSGYEMDVNFTVREAVRTPAFWLISLSFAFRAMVSSALAVHQIPFLIDRGFSPLVAASGLGSAPPP